MVTHVDHNEHDVRVIVTDQGVADLRNKAPMQRAREIIENCVHPDYKQLMWDYLKICRQGHMPHNLKAAFAMHQTFQELGDMRLTDFSKFE